MLLSRRRVLCTLGSLALAACEPAASPRPGAAAWREFTTTHLTLTTALPQENARRFALLAEEIYRTMRDVGFPSAPNDGHVFVVLPRDERESEALLGKYRAGEFHTPRLNSRYARRPAIAVLMNSGAGPRVVLAHELTHYLVHQSYGGNVPTWLNEGLAQYYSGVDVRDGYVFLGGPFNEREVDDGLPTGPGLHPKRRVPLSELVPPSRLIQTDDSDFYGAGGTDAERNRVTALYLSSYLFVHLLRNGPPDYVKRGSVLLEEVGGLNLTARTYERAFAGVDPAPLDADFMAWARWRTRPVRRQPYELQPVSIDRERVLDADDLRVAVARVTGR